MDELRAQTLEGFGEPHWAHLSRRKQAALLYPLIESAKLAGVEPLAYFGQAARGAIRSRGTVTLARDAK